MIPFIWRFRKGKTIVKEIVTSGCKGQEASGDSGFPRAGPKRWLGVIEMPCITGYVGYTHTYVFNRVQLHIYPTQTSTVREQPHKVSFTVCEWYLNKPEFFEKTKKYIEALIRITSAIVECMK